MIKVHASSEKPLGALLLILMVAGAGPIHNGRSIVQKSNINDTRHHVTRPACKKNGNCKLTLLAPLTCEKIPLAFLQVQLTAGSAGKGGMKILTSVTYKTRNFSQNEISSLPVPSLWYGSCGPTDHHWENVQEWSQMESVRVKRMRRS